MLWTDTKAGSNFINISQNAVPIDGGCSTRWGIETCTVIVCGVGVGENDFGKVHT